MDFIDIPNISIGIYSIRRIDKNTDFLIFICLRNIARIFSATKLNTIKIIYHFIDSSYLIEYYKDN